MGPGVPAEGTSGFREGPSNNLQLSPPGLRVLTRKPLTFSAPPEGGRTCVRQGGASLSRVSASCSTACIGQLHSKGLEAGNTEHF